MLFAKLPFISPIAKAFQKPQHGGATEVLENTAAGHGPAAALEDALEPGSVNQEVESESSENELESLEDIFGSSDLSKSKEAEEEALNQQAAAEQEPANPFKKASAGGERGPIPPYLLVGPGGSVPPGAAIEPGGPTPPGAAIEPGASGIGGNPGSGGVQLSQAHIDYHSKPEDPSTLGTSARPGEGDGGQSSGSPGPLNVQDRLASTLEDIFHKKVVTNPLVKALLEKHGNVDLRQLASELNEFSNGLKANQQEK